MPLPVPVLRREAAAVVSTLPALGRRVPRRSVQHRLLRAADPMASQVPALGPAEFTHPLGDPHLYRTHLEQARLQLSRAPRALPRMHVNPAVKDLFAFRYEDFRLEGYDPHPHIKAEVAV